MKTFWQSLPADRRKAVCELFLVYFGLGLAVILLGSVLPDLRDANGLNYTQSGNLLSVQSVGFLLSGLITGAAVLRLGMKRSYLLFIASLPVGLFMIILGGSYPFLLVAMLLVGIAKGSITDYNNRVMSDYTKGDASPINFMHMFFAIGACIAPFLALGCGVLFRGRGWIAALVVSDVLAAAAVILCLFVRMDLSAERGDGAAPATERKGEGSASAERSASSLAFFRDPLFLWTLLIGICDQAMEASLMGWITTFYLDTGAVSAQTAQLVTSLLWFAFLSGRLGCSFLAQKWAPSKMLLMMGVGCACFTLLLILGQGAAILFLATAGLGLCLSGMYGTSVSNASRVFASYPAAMGLFVSIAGIGGVVAPAAIGIIAEGSSVRNGFFVLAAVAIALSFIVLMNHLYLQKARRV